MSRVELLEMFQKYQDDVTGVIDDLKQTVTDQIEQLSERTDRVEASQQREDAAPLARVQALETQIADLSERIQVQIEPFHRLTSKVKHNKKRIAAVSQEVQEAKSELLRNQDAMRLLIKDIKGQLKDFRLDNLAYERLIRRMKGGHSKIAKCAKRSHTDVDDDDSDEDLPLRGAKKIISRSPRRSANSSENTAKSAKLSVAR